VIIDVLIVLVVLGAAWVGFQRGLVQPLLAELFALATLLIILHNRDAFGSLTGALFHAGGFLAVIVGLVMVILMGYLGAKIGGAIHRMPVVRGVDGFLGVFFQVLFGIALCYVLISGIIVANRALAPLTTPNLSARQIVALEQQLAGNPFTSTILQGGEVATINALAARPGGIKVSDIPIVGQIQSTTRDLLAPQLAGSHLAPFVMNVGHRIPGLGSFVAADLPKRGT
jgi:hypothetical protein